jgi:hypothetical protein
LKAMNTINAILEMDADGTLHLPVAAELRGRKIEVTATLRAANGHGAGAEASPEMVRRREMALASLRGMGGLGGVIADPAEWQREQRRERPLPGRDE